LSETKSGKGLVVHPGFRCRSIRATLPHSQGAIMITEIAQIDVKPGMEAEFETGVKNAAPVFQRAKGCHGLELQRSIEKPSRYRLFVKWGTVENHTVDFRGSADFQEWRKHVAHCFASPPEVEHVNQVLKAF
jgi:quinol monooxygenase YgiN